MAEVMVAVDGTRVVTAPTFQGCGKLSVTERQRNRQGVQVEIVKFLFGWRLIALLDLRTLIPLAIKIVQIQEHEAPYLVALVQQAQANLAPHSRISQLVIDRAYVDGASLYALHELGITFVVIAKSNMAVRAVALAEQAGTPIYERTRDGAPRAWAGGDHRSVGVAGAHGHGSAALGRLSAAGRRRSGPCVGRSAPSCTP